MFHKLAMPDKISFMGNVSWTLRGPGHPDGYLGALQLMLPCVKPLCNTLISSGPKLVRSYMG